MSAFNKLLARYPAACNAYQEIVATRALDMVIVGNNSAKFMKYPQRVMSNKLAFASLMQCNLPVDMIEIMAIGNTLAYGPKIFRPKQLELEMLEQITLNVRYEDWVQPFDTIVIELPENYWELKTVDCPAAGSTIYGIAQPEKHYPVIVIVHNIPRAKTIIAAMYFSSMVSIKTAIDLSGNTTIEEQLEKLPEFEGCLETSKEEWVMTKAVLHAALNFCLLGDEFGVRMIGKQNEAHYNRLKRWSQLKKNASKKEELQREMERMPCFYELKQEVKLYRTVESHSDLPSEPTGRTLPPHHRRGYYKMQPHGPKSTWRKRIRIDPVFVNAHLFKGNMRDARAIYVEF